MKKQIKRISALMVALLFVLCCGCASTTHGQQQENEKYYQATTYGGTPIGSVNETIEYDHKTTNECMISTGIPEYYAFGYTCGISAGGNVVAYYNKQYPTLIPGHLAGMDFFGTWCWMGQNEYIDALHTNLYIAMGANPSGTTLWGYLGGLASYVGGKGKSLAISDVSDTSSSLDPAYIAAINDNKLITLFLDGFNIIDNGAGFNTYNGYDIAKFTEYFGAHVMVAYGYKIVSYYDDQNYMFREDTYLYVGTSYNIGNALLRINTNCTIDEAYVTQVF